MNKINFGFKGLEKLHRSIEAIPTEQNVRFDELFSQSFMTKYTKFESINEMVNKSPFKVESEEDFKNIPDTGWDKYVRENTSFQSWGAMYSKATEEYLGKQVKKQIEKA